LLLLPGFSQHVIARRQAAPPQSALVLQSGTWVQLHAQKPWNPLPLGSKEVDASASGLRTRIGSCWSASLPGRYVDDEGIVAKL
jgi:hypothetical protein